MDTKKKTQKRKLRQGRVRAKVFGTSSRPRLSVFKSNKYISAQLIDDGKKVSLLQLSDLKTKDKKTKKTESAFQLGKKIAETAKAKKVSKVVFDKGGYKFIGRVKALADGAREGGLEF